MSEFEFDTHRGLYGELHRQAAYRVTHFVGLESLMAAVVYTNEFCSHLLTEEFVLTKEEVLEKLTLLLRDHGSGMVNLYLYHTDVSDKARREAREAVMRFWPEVFVAVKCTAIANVAAACTWEGTVDQCIHDANHSGQRCPDCGAPAE